MSDREQFEGAMVAAGYNKPEQGSGGGYLYQRDEDRFVGWSLATHAGAAAEPSVEQVERELGMGHGSWDMEDPAVIISTVLRLTALTSAPAEPVAGWSDDQMIRFGNYIRSNSADSHEQRLELFRKHEALRGIPAPAETPPVAERTAPMCRDCADFGPICPNNGKPCAPPAAGAIDARDLKAAIRTAWQRVPPTPTKEMIEAAANAPEMEDAKQDIENMWRAMLAAAPGAAIEAREQEGIEPQPHHPGRWIDKQNSGWSFPSIEAALAARERGFK